MIEAIRTWLRECPCINDLKDVGVDFLSSDVETASIDKTPSSLVLNRFMDGSSRRQQTFTLRAWFPYSDENRQNIENSAFLENVCDWIDEQVEDDNMPNLGANKECESVEINTSDYLINVSPNGRKACYQVQLRMTYIKKATDIFAQFYK